MTDRKCAAWLAAIAGTILLAVPGAGQPSAITADEVIAQNVAARGGMAQLEGVHSARLAGHIRFGSGSAHPLTVELARPGRIRTEITLDNGMIVQGYDGIDAWALNSVAGNSDSTAHVLPTGEAQNVAAGADMDGPLVHYAAKGNRVTYAGIDTADGRPAYRLDVTTAAGLSDSYYIDTTSHLQTKWRGHRVVQGAPVVFVSFFRDYRSIDGVMFAYRIDSGTEGQPGGQRIVLDSVQLNLPVSDARYTMPKESHASAMTH